MVSINPHLLSKTLLFINIWYVLAGIYNGLYKFYTGIIMAICSVCKMQIHLANNYFVWESLEKTVLITVSVHTSFLKEEEEGEEEEDCLS